MHSNFFKIFTLFTVLFLIDFQIAAIAAQKPSDIPIKNFAQLKSTSGLKLSPDGTQVAHFLPYKGRQMVVIKPIRGGKPVFVPQADNAEISWFRWANDNRIILSYGFTDKRGTVITRETRLYAIDANGENFRGLVKPKKRKLSLNRFGVESMVAQSPFIIDWLRDDPDHILVSLDGDQDGQNEVRRVNINTGKFKEIFKGKRGIQRYRTDQQNEIRLARGYYMSQFNKLYKSPITNQWRNIEKTSWGDKGFDLVDFTEDPKIAYARGKNEYGREALYKIDLETDKILEPVFSHEKVDFDQIIDHPVSDKPVGVEYTVDKTEIVYFDKKMRIIQKTVDRALPDTVNRIVSIQPEKKHYLIYAQSDVEPGAYLLLDMTEKTLNYISETMPGIAPEDMSPVKAVSYKSRDGVDIPAYLTIPKGKEAKNLPMVVLVHGGPQSRYDQMFHYIVQFLASRGYAVLQPNFRGSTGYGHEFAKAGEHQWGGVMQDDVTDGTNWLIEQAIADPGKVCIAGSSYGGYAAAMGLIKTPDLFACGISISAVLNMPDLIAFDKKFIGGKSWTKTMGLKGANPKTVSPYHRADEITAPILIIHAKDDHRIRYSQAKSMAKKLKKLKKDVTFVTLEDGDHNLDTETSRITQLTAIEKFLQKHIGQ